MNWIGGVVKAAVGQGTAEAEWPKNGSAQESDEGCILGGFLENEDFSPSRRLNTRFQRKWAEFAALLWKWRAEGGREE
jgi:hypothetical protein